MLSLMGRGRNEDPLFTLVTVLIYPSVHFIYLNMFSNNLFNVSTWLSKVTQWIVTHYPAIVSQEVTDLVWLVQQLHLLLQSHVWIWEGEIPETDR